jgi:hypothetical protein
MINAMTMISQNVGAEILEEIWNDPKYKFKAYVDAKREDEDSDDAGLFEFPDEDCSFAGWLESEIDHQHRAAIAGIFNEHFQCT